MLQVWIYESEVRAIAHETACWNLETGGDLFGKWEPSPVILLATRMGPKSQRTVTSCRFDLVHLEHLSRKVACEWGLDYFGDWHSHGHSQLVHPSRVDRERIGRVLSRNRFPRMLEFISNRCQSRLEVNGRVSVNGYHFVADTWFDPTSLRISILPGISPLREKLVQKRDITFEQEWTAWTRFSLSAIDGLHSADSRDHWLVHYHQERVRRWDSGEQLDRIE